MDKSSESFQIHRAVVELQQKKVWGNRHAVHCQGQGIFLWSIEERYKGLSSTLQSAAAINSSQINNK